MTPARSRSTTMAMVVAMTLCGINRAVAQQTAGTAAQPQPGLWSATPFVGFGFSGDLDSPTGALGVAGQALDASSTEFIVNLGGGVERAIRDNIRFRGDMRYFFGGDLVPDYWRLSTGLQFGVGRR